MEEPILGELLMGGGGVSSLVQFIRRIATSGMAEVADEQLLTRIKDCQDETAFANIVLRHGPLVQYVCRQLLQNPQDVEDAFQATFLVLVRRAGSLMRFRSKGRQGQGLWRSAAGSLEVAMDCQGQRNHLGSTGRGVENGPFRRSDQVAKADRHHLFEWPLQRQKEPGYVCVGGVWMARVSTSLFRTQGQTFLGRRAFRGLAGVVRRLSL